LTDRSGFSQHGHGLSASVVAALLSVAVLCAYCWAVLSLRVLVRGPSSVSASLVSLVPESMTARGASRWAGMLASAALAGGTQILVASVLLTRLDEVGALGAAALAVELALSAVWTWRCVGRGTL
jgi:hypothetical protein